MAKKYFPSGYQIINLIIVDDGDGNLILQDSEDKKLIEKIIENNRLYEKPLLLHLKDVANDYDLMGFATITDICVINTGFGDVDYTLSFINGSWNISLIEGE